MTKVNPWEVDNIDAFCYFCCPECVYRSKEEFSFQAHALQNHPKSETFFQSFHDYDFDDMKVEVKLEPGTEGLDDGLDDEDLPDEDVPELKFENDDDNMDQDDDDFNAFFDNADQDEPKEKYEKDAAEVDGVVKCTKCSQEFDSGKELYKHLEDVHAEKIYQNSNESADETRCPKCLDTFKTLLEMAMHFNDDHEKTSDNQYACPICETKQPSISKFKAHIEGVHLKVKAKCPLCDSVVSSHSLKNHMRTSKCKMRANKPFKCEECDFSTHADRYLKNHIMKNHKKEINPYACDKCERTFLFPEKLAEHEEDIHQRLKTFFCDKCGKGFSKREKYLFNKHVSRGYCYKPKNYATPESARCDICNDTFGGIQYLIQHYRDVHDSLPNQYKNKKLFMCDQCPNVYLSRGSMGKHKKKVHSEKPFKKEIRQCPHCEKQFKALACLKEHVAVKHEGSTPFKCDQCQRSFGTQDYLKTHIRNVHRRLKCDECAQEFCNSFILKRHRATVHNIRPTGVFQCDSCPLFFNQKGSLEQHVKKQHPDA